MANEGWKKLQRMRQASRQMGYTYEAEIAKALTQYHVEHHSLFYHKLPDTHILRQMIRKVKREFGQLPISIQKQFGWLYGALNKMSLPKQPGDFLLIFQGIGGILELKSSKQESLYLSQMFSDHQISYSSQIEVYGGGFYYNLICCRIVRDNHFTIILNREELRDALIEEERRRDEGEKIKLTWTELASYSHIPVIFAKGKRESEETYFTKWELGCLIEDIRRRYIDVNE